MSEVLFILKNIVGNAFKEIGLNGAYRRCLLDEDYIFTIEDSIGPI